MAKARDILRDTPLIDGHNDLPWQYRKRVDNHLGQIDLNADTSKLDPPLHTGVASYGAPQTRDRDLAPADEETLEHLEALGYVQ